MIKKIIYIITFCLISQITLSAGSDISSSSIGSEYKEAQKLVKRGKKLEDKGKSDKAIKLYSSAYSKLLEANTKDKNNPDILNYLGFTLRKAGNYKEAEVYYLKGLKINPKHVGINEYLGELYVKTNRVDLAKERLAVLKNCKCEEFEELKEIIEKN
ncbi:MAG: Tetratricopeptide (TPR) repeat [Pelagibacterales bacterium]|nr:Tetratricopeptide (TPR) repeat [Pelagibacterales bacterium]|tara:strand:+ start:95 stop:565 length:471 start_codon:yes stop_codon:yes gene_type:complete